MLDSHQNKDAKFIVLYRDEINLSFIKIINLNVNNIIRHYIKFH